MTPPRAPEILFEDADLLVVAKPAGLLSVPPSGGGRPNLLDRLRRQAAARGAQIFAVHRLDRDTSGVLVFARTEQARAALEEAFRTRAVEKRYLALVQGRPPRAGGTVRSFIEDRGMAARSHPRPRPGAKEAVTRYRVLETFADAALVEALPDTGRFNQIRLHMVDLGCPIAGDRKYAVAARYRLKAPRVLLHAAGLAFPHPRHGRRVSCAAPLPADFERILAALRSGAPPQE